MKYVVEMDVHVTKVIDVPNWVMDGLDDPTDQVFIEDINKVGDHWINRTYVGRHAIGPLKNHYDDYHVNDAKYFILEEEGNGKSCGDENSSEEPV